jgi:hypothetical protein
MTIVFKLYLSLDFNGHSGLKFRIQDFQHSQPSAPHLLMRKALFFSSPFMDNCGRHFEILGCIFVICMLSIVFYWHSGEYLFFLVCVIEV